MHYYLKQSIQLLFTLFILSVIASCGAGNCEQGCEIAESEDKSLLEQITSPVSENLPVGGEIVGDFSETGDSVIETVTQVFDENVQGETLSEPTVTISNGSSITITEGESLTVQLDSDSSSFDASKWSYDLEGDQPAAVELSGCANQSECTFTSTELSTVGSYTISVQVINYYPDTYTEQFGLSSQDGRSTTEELSVTVEEKAPEAVASNDDSVSDSSDDDSDSSDTGVITLQNGTPWSVEGTQVPVTFKYTATSQCQSVISGTTGFASILDIEVYTDSGLSSLHGTCDSVVDVFSCDPIIFNAGTYYILVKDDSGQGNTIDNLQVMCS